MSPGLARTLCAPLLAAALLAGPGVRTPSASAATIGISAGTLIAGAEPGDGPMSLSGFVSGTELVLDGVDFTVVTPGCSTGPATVSCALSGFTSLVIIGSSGDDAIVLNSLPAQPFAITIIGGDGDDIILGSAGDDVIFGGGGDDILFGGDGFDLLAGGSGANLLFEGEGTPGPEPDVAPLPRQFLPAPTVPALVLGALGALALIRRKRDPA